MKGGGQGLCPEVEAAMPWALKATICKKALRSQAPRVITNRALFGIATLLTFGSNVYLIGMGLVLLEVPEQKNKCD